VKHSAHSPAPPADSLAVRTRATRIRGPRPLRKDVPTVFKTPRNPKSVIVSSLNRLERGSCGRSPLCSNEGVEPGRRTSKRPCHDPRTSAALPRYAPACASPLLESKKILPHVEHLCRRSILPLALPVCPERPNPPAAHPPPSPRPRTHPPHHAPLDQLHQPPAVPHAIGEPSFNHRPSTGRDGGHRGEVALSPTGSLGT
jgi:hypothetical protein